MMAGDFPGRSYKPHGVCLAYPWITSGEKLAAMPSGHSGSPMKRNTCGGPEASCQQPPLTCQACGRSDPATPGQPADDCSSNRFLDRSLVRELDCYTMVPVTGEAHPPPFPDPQNLCKIIGFCFTVCSFKPLNCGVMYYTGVYN